jgi:hypothetical protein
LEYPLRFSVILIRRLERDLDAGTSWARQLELQVGPAEFCSGESEMAPIRFIVTLNIATPIVRKLELPLDEEIDFLFVVGIIRVGPLFKQDLIVVSRF